jgi:hypothetical protein
VYSTDISSSKEVQMEQAGFTGRGETGRGGDREGEGREGGGGRRGRAVTNVRNK